MGIKAYTFLVVPSCMSCVVAFRDISSLYALLYGDVVVYGNLVVGFLSSAPARLCVDVDVVVGGGVGSGAVDSGDAGYGYGDTGDGYVDGAGKFVFLFLWVDVSYFSVVGPADTFVALVVAGGGIVCSRGRR